MVPKSAGYVPHAIFRVDFEKFYFLYGYNSVQEVTSKKLEIFSPNISVLSGPDKVLKVRDKYRRTPKCREMANFSLPVGVFGHNYSPQKITKFRTLFFGHFLGILGSKSAG